MINKFQFGLRHQLFFSVLVSAFIGVIAFNVIFILGTVCLDKTVYGEIYASAIEKKEFSNLQEYVTTNNISSNNLDRLNTWVKNKNKLSLTIYHNLDLIYPTSISKDSKDQLHSKYYDINFENPAKEQTLILVDDIKVRSFIYYYAGDGFYYLLTLMSIGFAFVIFSFCFIVFLNKKISYINNLKKELDILAGGHIEYNVTVKGNDELTELANGINQMRCSILNHQEMEKNVQSANTELITALSHDLKTPITSLLMYLELIQHNKYKDNQQLSYLVNRCINQTMRIKTMSDELFEYFFVYATDWHYVDKEIFDANSFITQSLEHYIFALENKGIKVNKISNYIVGDIKINSGLMKRVFDNVYSNLLKYANLNESITFSYGMKDSNIYIEITNSISPNVNEFEKNNIGLKTCKKIIHFHKGTFEVFQEPDKFITRISLPIIN